MVEPPYRIKNMMPGMIMLWHGSVATIPSGWTLCDGLMGTPDLRNKFVACAGDSYAPGAEGGSDSQTHTFTGEGHYHDMSGPPLYQSGVDLQSRCSLTYVTGNTGSSDNRPTFYALCYIMKL